MVVMAVRDAGITHRVARLGLRLLVAAGFAVTAWFLGILLGNFTASAEETPRQPGTHPASATEPRLLSTVTTTVAGLLGTVDQVAGKVDQVASKVTESVVRPVTTAIEKSVVAPAREVTQAKPKTGVATSRLDSSLPSTTESAVVATAPVWQPPAAQPARARSTIPEPVSYRHPVPRPSIPDTGRPAAGEALRGGLPAPPPARSGDQIVGVATAHDSGGGKHPLAVLDSGSATVDLRPSGGTAGQCVLDYRRNAALPSTSPD